MIDTWINDVEIVLNQLGGKAHLSIIYDRINGMRNMDNNEHLQESVRSTLNSNMDKFISYGEGVWGNVRVMTREELADYLKSKIKIKELKNIFIEKQSEY